jgi:hypothetical protein
MAFQIKQLRWYILIPLLLLVGLSTVHLATVNANPGTFTFGGALDGTNYPSSEYEDHVVHLIAGEQVSATATCNNHDDMDTQMWVFLPNGTEFMYDDEGNGGWLCAGIYHASAVSFSAPLTGDFVFRVGTWDYPADMPYTLTVSIAGNDQDGDGFAPPADCNMNDATTYPGAPDSVGDSIDQNCDGVDGIAPPDADNDTYRSDVDCNDNNASINPGATDIAGDGIDQNCDGVDGIAAPVDADNDTYAVGVDCNDNDASINPGATEIPDDGIDQDCSGADLVTPPPADVDGDTYAVGVDCNDNDASIHPGATEVADDGIDQDCNGFDLVTPQPVDTDGDTYAVGVDCNDNDASIHPGATEVADDGIDQDCDGADGVKIDSVPPTTTSQSVSTSIPAPVGRAPECGQTGKGGSSGLVQVWSTGADQSFYCDSSLSGAQIGIQAVLDQGVISAIDLRVMDANGQETGFIAPAMVCLQIPADVTTPVGIIYLDATGQPRTAQWVSAIVSNNYACAAIPNPGIVVLVHKA